MENSNKKITYSDIEDIVEYLVKTKSRNYVFGSWDKDDIGQEIRIICFQKLKHFNPDRVERSRWKNFFGRCVDNALKNLKRDNYVRPSPSRRINLDNMTPDEIIEFKKTDDYSRWRRFQVNLQRKLRILHPIPIYSLHDIIKHNKQEAELEYKDLEKHVVDLIGEELKIPLTKMLNGEGKNVSKKDKRKVQKFVKQLF